MTPEVRALLDSIDWESVECLCGSTGHIPAAIVDLIEAETEEDALAAYWKLDNHVVVQGEVLNISLPLIPVLLAALLEDVAEHARYWMLELLVQMGSGRERVLDNRDTVDGELGIECRELVVDGFWVYLMFCRNGSDRVRITSLELAGMNAQRSRLKVIRTFIAEAAGPKSSNEVRQVAKSLLADLA